MSLFCQQRKYLCNKKFNSSGWISMDKTGLNIYSLFICIVSFVVFGVCVFPINQEVSHIGNIISVQVLVFPRVMSHWSLRHDFDPSSFKTPSRSEQNSVPFVFFLCSQSLVFPYDSSRPVDRRLREEHH